MELDTWLRRVGEGDLMRRTGNVSNHNKQAHIRPFDPTGLDLTIGDKYRTLVATTWFPVPCRPGWNLISILISVSASASQAVAACGARPAVRAVNRGSIKSISWRVWCKYKCPTKYNIDYTIARRARHEPIHGFVCFS